MTQIFAFPGSTRHAAPAPAPNVGTDTETALAGWIGVQTRVVDYWLDRLVGEDADPRLIGLLHRHAAFLREAGGAD